ncbi:MAG: hypothetical protein E7466_05235 [Ruminococcaceae bacterium]|nr:hypothetical protein [Oscillospiraceae bacterium]
MTGKSKCKILKQIRQQIADENDIAYVTSECKYQGDCAGTCPKCESELQYLENELRKRQAAGKAVVVAGIAATLMMGLTACAEEEVHKTTGGTPPVSTSLLELEGDVPASTDDIPASTDRIEVEGDIALPPEDGEDETLPPLMGEPVYPPDDELGGVPPVDVPEEDLTPDDVPEEAPSLPPEEDVPVVNPDSPDEDLPVTTPEPDEDDGPTIPENSFVDEEPGIDDGDWGALH